MKKIIILLLVLLFLLLTGCSPAQANSETSYTESQITEEQDLDAEFERVIAAWISEIRNAKREGRDRKSLAEVMAAWSIQATEVVYYYQQEHRINRDSRGNRYYYSGSTCGRILQMWPSGIIRAEWQEMDYHSELLDNPLGR